MSIDDPMRFAGATSPAASASRARFRPEHVPTNLVRHAFDRASSAGLSIRSERSNVVRNKLIVACALTAALLGPATASRADVDVVPYGAGGWRYQTYVDLAAVPGDWASRAFNDSRLAEGAMPFGSWETGGASCPLAPEANGIWPSPGFLLVRRSFVLPRGATDVRLYLGIDNDALVAVNGIVLGSEWIHHENCPARDDFFVDVPRGLLNRQGANVLAVLAHDSGVESWIDVRVVAD